MKFKIWLENEVETPKKSVSYYLELAGLPHKGIEQNPNAYQLIQQAYEKLKLQNNPEAHAAYIALHGYLDRRIGGRHFDNFFTNVTSGKEEYVPHTKFTPILDMNHHYEWTQAREKYHGHFDNHIKTSIPTFGELQDKKGHAIIKAFKDEDLEMLDIGGSEGSFARTISHLTNGRIQTEILDPNNAMHDFYHSKGQTPGSKYTKAAFMKGWINDDGTKTPELNSQNTEKRYDIVHEAMAFQFISNQRDAQVSEAKSLLKPDGLFLSEQKLKNDNWDENEAFKDQHHKNLYYSQDALKKKEKVVGFAASKFDQNPDEEQAVGMVDNMVHHNEYEQTLVKHFKVVYQYWDSGNFKGYAASDYPDKVSRFLHALGNINSKFSNVQLPRRITLGESVMASFKEWSKKHDDKQLQDVFDEILKDLDGLTYSQIKNRYGDKIIHAARNLDIDLTDSDVRDIIDKACGINDCEPHINHYHHHN